MTEPRQGDGRGLGQPEQTEEAARLEYIYYQFHVRSEHSAVAGFPWVVCVLCERK